jgi:capsular polysaccharide biosynthesis protein
MPQQNEWMVCRAIAVFNSERLSPEGSQSYPGSLPNCQHPEVNLPRLDSVTLPPVVAIEGVVAALTGLSANIYFHWMIDILPRLYFLQQAGWELEAIDWFLINYQTYAFQQETLRLVGVPESKILQSDRHPHITATRLIVPPASPLGWAHPTAVQFLRQTFLPQFASCSSIGQSYPERIYITRSQARHRRVLNEAEGDEYLSKMGFVAYALESLSVLEQVALFHHAQVILAPHGSGLTNLAFCQPGTTVIELFSPQYIRPYYWVISHHLRLNHYYLVSAASACRPLRQLMYPSPLTEDLWIDWPQAKTALEKILSLTKI